MRRNALKELRKDQSGQTLIVTALCMTVLLGFVSLAVDVGMLLRAKTNLQKVADDAAIAGAAELLKSGNYNIAALTSATQNGVSSGVAVSLGTPYHPGAVNVVVTQSQQTYLAALFGVQNATVTATAAAGLVNSGNACLYTLGQNQQGYGIVINGSPNGGVNMPNCGVYDDYGLALNGQNASITAKWVGVGGTVKGTNPTTPLITGMVPVNDPLATYWQPQPPSQLCSTATSYGSQTYTTGLVPPGCYTDLTVNGAATFSGLYVVQGKLNVNVTSTSTGASFFVDKANGGTLSCSQCNFNVNGSIAAPPLTSGTSGTCSIASGCDGLVLWDTEVTALTGNNSQPVTLGGNITLTGILYAPNAFMKFNGSGTTTLNAAIVSAQLELDGAVTINSYALGAGTISPFSSAALVE
jgi:Flp pilus assembly protein TadG